MSISEISPSEVFEKMNTGEHLQLLDVREVSERNTTSVDKSIHIPLNQVANKAKTLDSKKAIYILCRSGQRARMAATQLEAEGCSSLYVIKGGMEAWVRTGLPINGVKTQVWSMDRQVRFTSGIIVLTGILLSFALNTNWIFLSAFAALGMVFSSITNTCGMATILSMMPWNCHHSH